MKATGIVRRIDDLGRVVIPKEIRRTLRIREGDSLEIFTEKESLVLQKYSPIKSIQANAQTVADGLFEATEKLCYICDNERVLCVSGTRSKEPCGKELSTQLEHAVKKRKTITQSKSEGVEVFPVFEGEKTDIFENRIIVPIVNQGDCYGAVVLSDNNKNQKPHPNDVKFVQLGAKLLANQI